MNENTLPWPQDWVQPTFKRSTLRQQYKPQVNKFLKQSRRKDITLDQFLAKQPKAFTRQQVYAHINHSMSLTKESMSWATDLFQKDPLELMLKTGHCPPELAYFLGWEVWEEFKEFLLEKSASKVSSEAINDHLWKQVENQSPLYRALEMKPEAQNV